MKVPDNEETPTVFENSDLTGVVGAFPNVEITPFRDTASGRTHFKATGDVKSALEKIAANHPVGSRDVLVSIKRCRSLIWLLKGGQMG